MANAIACKEETGMDRLIPGWMLWIALALAGVFGVVATAQGRRKKQMRRMVRRACKNMSNLSSAVLHMFP